MVIIVIDSKLPGKSAKIENKMSFSRKILQLNFLVALLLSFGNYFGPTCPISHMTLRIFL